jgi:hypothetical protein
MPTAHAKSADVSASTRGYRMLIGALQVRHRARSAKS